MSRADGAGGLVRSLVDEATRDLDAARQAAAGEQLDLIGIASTGVVQPYDRRKQDEKDETREEREARHAAALASADAQRKAGRPPGSANRSTQAFRDFLFKRNASPAMKLIGFLQHTPESLALELGCSKADAFDRLVGVARELMPYELSKLAPVDEKGNAVMPSFTFTLNGEADAGPGPGAVPPWERRRAEVVDVEAAPAPARPADAEPPVSDAARAAYDLMRPGDEGPAR